MSASLSTPGLTVADLAQRYRVSPDKVRAWIARGELAAVNTASALCGKPRWVVTAEALVAFEKRRAGARVTPVKRKRRMVDEIPDRY